MTDIAIKVEIATLLLEIETAASRSRNTGISAYSAGSPYRFTRAPLRKQEQA